MTESRVFADSYSRKFSDFREFLSFLTEREQNSRWVMSSSKKLEFEPIEKDSPTGNLHMQIYDSNGKAEHDGEYQLADAGKRRDNSRSVLCDQDSAGTGEDLG